MAHLRAMLKHILDAPGNELAQNQLRSDSRVLTLQIKAVRLKHCVSNILSEAYCCSIGFRKYWISCCSHVVWSMIACAFFFFLCMESSNQVVMKVDDNALRVASLFRPCVTVYSRHGAARFRRQTGRRGLSAVIYSSPSATALISQNSATTTSVGHQSIQCSHSSLRTEVDMRT